MYMQDHHVCNFLHDYLKGYKSKFKKNVFSAAGNIWPFVWKKTLILAFWGKQCGVRTSLKYPFFRFLPAVAVCVCGKGFKMNWSLKVNENMVIAS